MERKAVKAAAAMLLCCMLLAACARGGKVAAGENIAGEADAASSYLLLADSDVDSVDPQCTAARHAALLNVFDRLTEIRVNADGSSEVAPSLAESWEVSDNGCIYTFRLREGVTFSNGSALTASDVGYTLARLLTHRDSCHQDIVSGVLGAEALRAGVASRLVGFSEHNDHEFAIVLSQPDAAFPARLAEPGASILDEETTRAAGLLFGKAPAYTIGTGPFILQEWSRGAEMRLAANLNCWSGAPLCGGLRIQLTSDGETLRRMFEEGTLDLLDLGVLEDGAEYFVHGDVYQDLLYQTPRADMAYIALNESAAPLDDVRVRRALQLALDREALMYAMTGGLGAVENGVVPRGVAGHDPALAEIPFDPAEARRLLAEAGCAEGFELEFDVPLDEMRGGGDDLPSLVSAMWRKVGVNVRIVPLEEEDFARRKESGTLVCYWAAAQAGYDDPDSMFAPFFDSAENARANSLCYGEQQVMSRVQRARTLTDPEERLREYRALERRLAQEDAAWIPLYSTRRCRVASARVDGFAPQWGGYPADRYQTVSTAG